MKKYVLAFVFMLIGSVCFSADPVCVSGNCNIQSNSRVTFSPVRVVTVPAVTQSQVCTSGNCNLNSFKQQTVTFTQFKKENVQFVEVIQRPRLFSFSRTKNCSSGSCR